MGADKNGDIDAGGYSREATSGRWRLPWMNLAVWAISLLATVGGLELNAEDGWELTAFLLVTNAQVQT